MRKVLLDILIFEFLFCEFILTDNQRQQLARLKFEQYCESQGQMLERICPQLEHCLLTPIRIKQRILRNYLEDKTTAHQFLHSFYRTKRFVFLNSDIKSNEKLVNERRRKGLNLYEHYCESTDDLSHRFCPAIDRCLCNDCNS